MNCPNCGKKIEENHKFCPSCGADIKTINEMKPNPSKNKSSLIAIIVIVIIILLSIIIFFILNKKEEKKELTSNTNTNSISNVSNNVSNENTNANTHKNTNSTSNTNQVPQNLTCTQNLRDQYGTYQVTHNYTFKNNQLSSYNMKMIVNLNKDAYKYRDNLIATYDKMYSQYKQVSGIKLYNTKRTDGFDYFIEIEDSKKVDKEKLKSMNLYLINYSGIKMAAYKNGATCK